jgi:hypothetical protein
MRIRLKQFCLLIMSICEVPHISVPLSKMTNEIAYFVHDVLPPPHCYGQYSVESKIITEEEWILTL